MEPQFVYANKSSLKALCKVLGLKHETYNTIEKLSDKLEKQKTTWALKIFEAKDNVIYPDYINRAVEWCNEQ